jgi:hypothetical protein
MPTAGKNLAGFPLQDSAFTSKGRYTAQSVVPQKQAGLNTNG